MSRVSMCLVVVVLLSALSAASAANDGDLLLECESLTAASTESWCRFKLATTIKRCLGLTLDTEVRGRLGELQRRLQASVHNAVFLDEVCIKVKRWNEYLYTPISGFLYDGVPKTRRIFTWIPGAWEHNNKGDWKLRHYKGNKFFLIAANNGEYLTVNDHVVDKRRRVSTSVPNWHFLNEKVALWELEPTGVDEVYIKNAEFPEYLYAVDGMNHDSQRRAVNTWSADDNGCENHGQCIWKIVPC